MRYGTYYRFAIIKKLKLDNYINRSSKWLDLGCHDGTILRAMKAQHKIGIDIETKKQQDFHIIKAVVEHLPFKEGSFNIITAFDVLEHIENDFQMINQVENKLTKNGLFIFSVPHDKEKIFPKFLNRWLVFSKWKHLRMGYNQYILKNLFKRNWKLKIIHWNTDFSNLLYFPLQFIWRTLRKFAEGIINKVIEIEFIRTRKNRSDLGHLFVIANKQSK